MSVIFYKLTLTFLACLLVCVGFGASTVGNKNKQNIAKFGFAFFGMLAFFSFTGMIWSF